LEYTENSAVALGSRMRCLLITERENERIDSVYLLDSRHR